MNAGASKDYKFGTKNNWRRFVWNRISERVNKPKKDCVVAYLAGASDLDREVAISRGFMSHNMIAVESDAEVAAQLKSSRVLTINENFLDVVKAWPPHRSCDVIHADLCSNLNDAVVLNLLLAIFYTPALWGAVISVNFLRGREHPASSDYLRRAKASIEAAGNRDKTLVGEALRSVGEKHRGMMFALFVVNLVERYLAAGKIGKNFKEVTSEDLAVISDIEANAVFSMMSPVFNSYKSGTQYFDSVVFINPCRGACGKEVISKSEAKKIHHDVNFKRSSEAARSIAAVMAHRTMRIERTGPYAEVR